MRPLPMLARGDELVSLFAAAGDAASAIPVVVPTTTTIGPWGRRPPWAPHPFPAALLLDRDGTIIEDAGYLSDPAAVRLLPGAAAAIARANRAGVPVAVVTNQSGVARGLFAETAVAEVHAALDALLKHEGGHVDLYLYCPHHPQAVRPEYRKVCYCRKPRPGLLVAAAERLQVELPACLMVGDRPSDVAAGVVAGCGRILLEARGARPAPGTGTSAAPSYLGSAPSLATALAMVGL